MKTPDLEIGVTNDESAVPDADGWSTAGNASDGSGYEPNAEDEHDHAGNAESSAVCQTTVSGYS